MTINFIEKFVTSGETLYFVGWDHIRWRQYLFRAKNLKSFKLLFFIHANTIACGGIIFRAMTCYSLNSKNKAQIRSRH